MDAGVLAIRILIAVAVFLGLLYARNKKFRNLMDAECCRACGTEMTRGADGWTWPKCGYKKENAV